MAYSDITFNDKNVIKRWLQQRRLVVATRLAARLLEPQVILDFGAGNGELCKHLATRFPAARIICYEPAPHLLEQARTNLAGFPRIEFCSDLADIARDSVELVFCLEVFEHLPKAETERVLRQIDSLLCPTGSLVIGVPVEIGLPALYKGAFRMFRRFGNFDATPRNVLLATLGFPPKDRPVAEFAPGLVFHHHHMGFDHRTTYKQLRNYFGQLRVVASPFSIFGAWLNPEIYFIVKKYPAAEIAGSNPPWT